VCNRFLLLLVLCLLAHAAPAQPVFEDNEILASDRAEAWAMNYLAATSLMTAFSATPRLEPGQWAAALDLGEIPRMSDAQQQVGFGGFKTEDLNRSPVFGRLRMAVGLPAGWVAELGYTPPVSIDGVRPRDVVALAVGRRVIERGNFTLSARAFGQHGAVRGDITCPRAVADSPDSEQNPYGCQAPSNDRFALNHYGIDLTSAWSVDPWAWHAGIGVARMELEVQVDAITFDVRDRSRLVAHDVLPFFTIGVKRTLTPHWSLGLEVLHVPLTVVREPGDSREHDPMTGLRLQVGYRGN
jgi:hypothetical protein